MRLIQAREQARNIKLEKWEHLTFDMVNTNELIIECKWIDPDEGTFQVIGENGFHTVDDHSNRNPQILNMQIERDS